MKYRQTLFPFIIAAALTMLLWMTLQGAQTASQTEGITANETQDGAVVADLAVSDTGLSFLLTVPAVSQNDLGKVEMPGLNARSNVAGAPDLPHYATFIALPPEATAVISVEPAASTTAEGWTVSAVPDPQTAAGVLEANEDFAQVNDLDLTSTPDPAVYGKNARYPGFLYHVSEPMYIRDNRLVKLELFPLQYNPVSKELTTFQEMQVTIEFEGGTEATRPLNGRSPFENTLDSLILNASQARNWASLPPDMRPGGTNLPVGTDAYKIQVDQDGVYEVSYTDLQNAGMNVNSINPNTFQMLYRGQPVAYKFIGDGDNVFENGEKVRFYGWAFNGSRLEKQFITDNVFWLWANGTPTTISGISSQNGLPLAPSFQSSITAEPENVWFSTWTDQWDTFPNEPDAWYWGTFGKSTAAPYTATLPIDLIHPASAGIDALITTEFSSKPNPVVNNLPISHEIKIKGNGYPNPGHLAWLGKQNVNVTTTMPITAVLSGTNSVSIGLHTASAVNSGQYVYLNRITIDYPRLFIADNDQLIFKDEVGGLRGFEIDGFSQGNINNMIIWDITNPEQPKEINGAAVSGGPNFTYGFGTNHPADSAFIITTNSNILSPNLISRYDVPDIDPSGGGAEWVAIAYKDLITETEVLAAHRANPFYGGYSTHVVDIEDVINQYGYGLPIPASVRDYMAHALADWTTAPGYLVLVGDATIDPRKVFWSANQYVMTDLAFVDRFNGQIPTDLPFTLLVGDDILPDIANGRIPAKTAAEVNSVVDKIIIYDQNQLFPSSWMNDFVFVSDNTDSGGNFCFENQVSGTHMPDIFNQTHLCLPDNPTTTDADNLRTELFNHINVTGTLLLNYRGHGAINTWASNPIILNQTYVNSWNNPVKPVVIVTGDCLDGYFAYPTNEGLAETFLRADGKGTAAHWSSTGLGLSDEHSHLVETLYDAIFVEGITTLGDAINYSKIDFDLIGGYRSVLYSFTLEGDPAMEFMRPELSIEKTADTTSGEPGDPATFTLDVTNLGIYPSQVVVTDTLPAGLDYISFTASIPTNVTVVGDDIVFSMQFGGNELNGGLPRGESASITLNAIVANDAISGTVTNSAVVGGGSLDTNPANNNDNATFDIYVKPILDFINYMPSLFKP